MLNIRFTVLENLSHDVIIGQEVLASLDFKTSGSLIFLGGYRFPLIPTDQTILLEVVDAVTVTDKEIPITVINVKPVNESISVRPNKTYLLSPILDDNSNFRRAQPHQVEALVPNGSESLGLGPSLGEGSEL